MYALIGMGIALILALGVAKIEHSGKLEAQAQVEAREATIRQQNAAVEALAAESARKQAAGAAALRQAEGKAKVWTDQALRLQAALTSRKPTDATDCKSAWQELRK
ncbi:MAG: hypothetical protein RLZZ182_2275 [Pseudomonadota bacterium]|jgi:hypothetical protein